MYKRSGRGPPFLCFLFAASLPQVVLVECGSSLSCLFPCLIAPLLHAPTEFRLPAHAELEGKVTAKMSTRRLPCPRSARGPYWGVRGAWRSQGLERESNR